MCVIGPQVHVDDVDIHLSEKDKSLQEEEGVREISDHGVPIPAPTLEYKRVGEMYDDIIIIDHLKTTGGNFNKISRGWQNSIIDRCALGLDISGGAGEEFHTCRGRELPFGESLGENSFNLSAPGGYAMDFAFGNGGHLHNIGDHFQLPPSQSVPSQPNMMMTEEDNEGDKYMPEILNRERQMKEFKAIMPEERENQGKFNYSINIKICILHNI